MTHPPRTPDRVSNVDPLTVDDFGFEWQRLDQTALSESDRASIFAQYFSLFPWQDLPAGAVGFDLGCGSGRWAVLVAPRVGSLHCIDPSAAIDVARRNLAAAPNCVFHRASVDALPLDDGSMDFGYALGSLHHVPDTEAGLRACVNKLKPGAPFLVYLYYALDDRPRWFRAAWRASDAVRRVVCRLPHGVKFAVSQAIALLVYLPLARGAGLLERAGVCVDHLPLSYYRHLGFYTMRTDALDRFGTRLEQRFTRGEIVTMMERAGLDRITVAPDVPRWCALGYRRTPATTPPTSL
jgi:SAM-dependent methyltransferase